jgi:ABC-type phosphate/phosphonate transport system substrate-binding protein
VLIADARMYGVTPAAASAWQELLSWVLERAAVEMTRVDSVAVPTLGALWQREDLGCAMMCGLPFALREPRPVLLAAPVPAPDRYGGRPVYCTDIAVRADSPFFSLEDTFGAVCGFTQPTSMSGYVAFRHLLNTHRRTADSPLYRSAVGDLVNARGVVEALREGRIDVGPLDGFSGDLLRQLDARLMEKVRVVASTALAPIPVFVATGSLPADAVSRLRSAFVAAGRSPELRTCRETLLLREFALPQLGDYDVFTGLQQSAERFPGIW